MRTALVAQLAVVAACGGAADHAPPALVDAITARGTHLGVADATAPLRATRARTSLRPLVALSFSERLDGGALEVVTTEPDTGAVRELTGRDGVVRIAPVDGSVVAESIAYDPAERAIRVLPATHLPAETDVLIHVMAGRVWDVAGNVVPAARYLDGEPVRDLDGRTIAATVAFCTEAIALRALFAPAYGALDDPTTEIDETVPYDAPMVLELNTAVVPTSVVATITQSTGELIGVTASATEEPTEIRLTPVVALPPASYFELRIDAATDRFGVPWRESPHLFSFSTL